MYELNTKHRGYNNGSGFYNNCGLDQYKGNPIYWTGEKEAPLYQNEENVSLLMKTLHDKPIQTPVKSKISKIFKAKNKPPPEFDSSNTHTRDFYKKMEAKTPNKSKPKHDEEGVKMNISKNPKAMKAMKKRKE
jgi:hypothetical protein